MTNKQLASTVLEYSRRGSQTTRPISSAPKELQDLWNRGNEEGISMIKVRKYKERYETKDGKSFRVHNYGKVSLNEVLPKHLRTGDIQDELSPILSDTETVVSAYKLIRDLVNAINADL